MGIVASCIALPWPETHPSESSPFRLNLGASDHRFPTRLLGGNKCRKLPTLVAHCQGGFLTQFIGHRFATSGAQALRQLVTANRSHVFENEYNRVTARSINANTTLASALTSAPA